MNSNNIVKINLKAEKFIFGYNIGRMLDSSRPGYKAWALINVAVPAGTLYFAYGNNK